MSLGKAEKAAATRLVGALYGKADCESFNELRCVWETRKNVSAKKLPPTDDIFELHLTRCILQLGIWREDIIPMYMHDANDPID